jgi:hypothetical protein
MNPERNEIVTDVSILIPNHHIISEGQATEKVAYEKGR